MVLLQLKDPLKLFARSKEFHPGSGVPSHNCSKCYAKTRQNKRVLIFLNIFLPLQYLMHFFSQLYIYQNSTIRKGHFKITFDIMTFLPISYE